MSQQQHTTKLSHHFLIFNNANSQHLMRVLWQWYIGGQKHRVLEDVYPDSGKTIPAPTRVQAQHVLRNTKKMNKGRKRGWPFARENVIFLAL